MDSRDTFIELWKLLVKDFEERKMSWSGHCIYGSLDLFPKSIIEKLKIKAEMIRILRGQSLPRSLKSLEDYNGTHGTAIRKILNDLTVTSKRIYPEKRCANPNCCGQHYFTPHDKRQKFCTPWCNDNYHNDLVSLERKNIKAYLKVVKLCEEKLGVIYNVLAYKSAITVNDYELHWHQIDLTIGQKEASLTSGKEIIWFNSYGLMKKDKKGKRFQIICRNDIKN